MANHPNHPNQAAQPKLGPPRFQVSLKGCKVRVPRCPHCKAVQPVSMTGERNPDEVLTCVAKCDRGTEVRKKMADGSPGELILTKSQYRRSEEDHQLQSELIVEALSPGDAIETYNRYNGVLASQHRHDVNPVV